MFKVYLVWRVKKSRIKKESTVMTYWKVLSMVYSQKTANLMRDEVLLDIRNVRVLVIAIISYTLLTSSSGFMFTSHQLTA